MAARFWVSGGNGNINSTTNWSATSGGASGASVPTSADDVTFDANGDSNATINVTATWLSLTITSGYTSTMTHNAVLTVAGNVTFGANYTIAGSSSMTISATSTITSNGKTWPNNFNFGGTTTKTLIGDLVILGQLSASGGNSTVNKTTNETISANGFTSGTNVRISGDAKLILTGGTWTTTGTNIGIGNPIEIQGDVTISGTVFIQATSLTYVSGTVTTTGSTLQAAANCTFHTDGISWDNIILTSGTALTLTINSVLTANSISLPAIQQYIFTGTHGFITNTFTVSSVSAITITLERFITYRVNTSFLCYFSRVGSIILFTSSHGTNRANLILNNPSTCNVLASFTRIDASGGRTINTFNGTVTDCVNIRAFNDLQTVGHS